LQEMTRKSMVMRKRAAASVKDVRGRSASITESLDNSTRRTSTSFKRTLEERLRYLKRRGCREWLTRRVKRTNQQLPTSNSKKESWEPKLKKAKMKAPLLESDLFHLL